MFGKVTINVQGRDGSVQYSEGPGLTIDGHFEFGGGDVVAIITMGSEDEWRRRYPWAVERREAILRFVGEDLIRRQAPQSALEVDAVRGAILLRGGVGGQPKAAADRAKAASFFWRLNKLKAALAAAVLAGTVVFGGIAVLGREAITMSQPLGSPLNESVRFDGGVATLISRTDPQGPRWSGRGGGETVTVSLLIVPFGDGEPRLTTLVRGVQPGGVSLARVLGSDGATVWADAGGLSGVRLDGGELVTPDDLRRANPGLDPSWWEDGPGMDISEGRLHIVRRDRSAALDVDPTSLRAQPAPVRLSPPRLSPPEQAEAMAAGFVTSDGAWLGLLTPEDQAGAYRPGRWVRPVEGTEAANVDRFLTRITLEPSSDRTRFRLRAAQRLSETAYRNAGCLRIDDASEPLRVQNPPGALMIYTQGSALDGVLVVARVDEAGRVLWTAQTGLDRYTLRQILAGEGVSAFVGARLPTPGRVSEPLLVFVDHATGAVTTHTLWR